MDGCINAIKDHGYRGKTRAHVDGIGKLLQDPEGCKIVPWYSVPWNKDYIESKGSKRSRDDDDDEEVELSVVLDHLGRYSS